MTWLTRMHLRTWQHQMTTIMQPFQCDLQTQHQETHRTTHRNNHSMQNTEEEPIELETIQTATAAHTRYLSSPAEAILHGKIQGFVLRLPPHNIAHATFMQPFQCDLPPQRQETHRTTHTGTTTRCKTHRRNRLNSKRSKPQPPHTRGTFPELPFLLI